MKNAIKINSFIFAIVLILNGCKKTEIIREEYNPAIPAYGTWAIVSSTIQADVKYLQFSTDKSATVYSENNMGFKSSTSSILTPMPDQLIFDPYGYGYSTIFNYKVVGDSIFITSPSYGDFKGVKSTDANVASWAKVVTRIDEISGAFTNNTYGIGFDGTNILMADYSAFKVNKISLSTRLPAGTIDVTGSYPTTVEFDGADIWVSSNGYDIINKHPLAGGGVVSTSKPMGPWIYGVAFDPISTNLWCFAGNTDTLYSYNKTSNTVTNRIGIGNGFRDMAWSNGKLFLTRENYIYRVNPSPFTVEKTYKLKENMSIYGIAAVGNDFWLSVSGSSLIKVTLN